MFHQKMCHIDSIFQWQKKSTLQEESLADYSLEFVQTFFGGQQEIRLHDAYPRCSRGCCCKNMHPYKSSNNKIPSKTAAT